MANQREMLEAGEKLVEYMDICHDNPGALTPLAVQRLMDVYKRHLALMMLHLTHRASFFLGGIPRGTPLGATKGTTEI